MKCQMHKHIPIYQGKVYLKYLFQNKVEKGDVCVQNNQISGTSTRLYTAITAGKTFTMCCDN